MAADLSIHIFEGIDEGVLKRFFSNTMGSKYFNPRPYDRSDDSRSRVHDTPSVWVGEVSWLKAALSGDADAYVPEPVAAVSEIIGEDLPVIDEALIGRIESAMRAPNGTGYSLASAEEVVSFLRAHIGRQAFTVSW